MNIHARDKFIWSLRTKWDKNGEVRYNRERNDKGLVICKLSSYVYLYNQGICYDCKYAVKIEDYKYSNKQYQVKVNSNWITPNQGKGTNSDFCMETINENVERFSRHLKQKYAKVIK
jgi:hypothetical protein